MKSCILVLAVLLAISQPGAALRPLPKPAPWVDPDAFVRRSLADSRLGPASAPGPAPTVVVQPALPPAASAISPAGTFLRAPIGSDDPSSQEEDHGHMKKGVLASIILVPTIVCGSILLSSYISMESVRKKLRKTFLPDENSSSDPPTPLASHQNGEKPVRSNYLSSQEKAKPAESIDYALLERATNGFSNEYLIGEGGFSRVYKAQLEDNRVVAVKKLSPENEHAEQEFMAEIELLGKISHSNLVPLLGFSSQGTDRLLVYVLMKNGSLQDQLQGPAQGAALTWNLRLKIALDAARGLEYLHDQCDPPVIHRDFKSSNILLDETFNAKLSDFGLALLAENSHPGSLQLQGTFGYVAPEYILTGSLTEKSDVYAFGVVLLELITGRKPIDMSMPTGCQSLVTWATPQLTDRTRLPQIVDAAIKDTVNLKQLFQVAAIAVLCVQSEPSYRPLIGDVVNSLVPLVPGALRAAEETTV